MTPTETLQTPLVIEREKKEKNALEKVTAWVVQTAEDYTALDAFLVGLADLKKMIVADFKDSKDKTAEAKRAATAAHKAVVDQEDAHLNIIEDARRIGKQKLFEYEEAERKETARKQAIADAEARKKAEDAAIAAAALAEKNGDKEKAEAIMAAPVEVAPTMRLSSMVPTRTTMVQTRWSAIVGGQREDGSKTDPLFVLHAVQAALKFMEKAKTPAAQAATEDLRQAEKDLVYMVYDQTGVNKLAVKGSPYVNGVLKLGGVSFQSRKV